MAVGLAQTPIKTLIERSVVAARVVKSTDLTAKLFRPASGGRPGWLISRTRQTGLTIVILEASLRPISTSFARLEHDERRLLDVYWYPFSRRGDLIRADHPELDQAWLDAPRSLDVPVFARQLGCERAASQRR